MKFRVFAVALCLVLLGGLVVAQDLCGAGGTSVGTAFFNHIINWELTGDAVFSVRGAPPNICGNLVTTRNGSLLCSPGWICTDANGNANTNTGGVGSWSWSNQPNDQVDINLHFNWTDGTTTYSTTNHYWDKTCPTPTINNPSIPPPSFTGTGTDGVGGGGFGSWTLIKFTFTDNGTATDPITKYWDPSTGNYTADFPPLILGSITAGSGTIGPGTIDSPSYNMNWNAGTFPPQSIHQVGHKYTWTVSLGESESTCIANNPGSSQSLTFIIPQNGDPGCRFEDCTPGNRF